MSPQVEPAERRGTTPTPTPRRRDRSNWYRADGIERAAYTVAEAAKLIGIGRRQAYEAALKGEIPAIRVGRRVAVPKAALHALLGLAPEGVPVESGNRRTATDGEQGGESRLSSRLPSGGLGSSGGGD